jgi:hypothetical protein
MPSSVVVMRSADPQNFLRRKFSLACQRGPVIGGPSDATSGVAASRSAKKLRWESQVRDPTRPLIPNGLENFLRRKFFG